MIETLKLVLFLHQPVATTDVMIKFVMQIPVHTLLIAVLIRTRRPPERIMFSLPWYTHTAHCTYLAWWWLWWFEIIVGQRGLHTQTLLLSNRCQYRASKHPQYNSSSGQLLGPVLIAAGPSATHWLSSSD